MRGTLVEFVTRPARGERCHIPGRQPNAEVYGMFRLASSGPRSRKRFPLFLVILWFAVFIQAGGVFVPMRPLLMSFRIFWIRVGRGGPP